MPKSRNQESAAVGAAVRQELAARGISDADFAERVSAQTGKPTNRQWVFRMFTGWNLLTEQRPVNIPNATLRLIAAAIDPEDADALAAKLANSTGWTQGTDAPAA